MNKQTDCWECRLTFGKKIPIGNLFGNIIYGKTVLAYDEGDILCCDCADKGMLMYWEKELKEVGKDETEPI